MDAGGDVLEEAHWGTAQKTENEEEDVNDEVAGTEGERKRVEGEDGERGVEGEVGAAGAEGEEPCLQSFFFSCLKVVAQRWVKEDELPCTPPLRTTFLLQHDRLHLTLVEVHGQLLGYSLLF